MTFNQQLAKANKTIHPVETEWHYKKLIKYGFIPETKSGVGLVRTYTYKHPITDEVIKCTTGVNADYWQSNSKKPNKLLRSFYCGGLEPYLKSEYNKK